MVFGLNLYPKSQLPFGACCLTFLGSLNNNIKFLTRGLKVIKDVTYKRPPLRGCTISSHDILSCMYMHIRLSFAEIQFS